MTDCASMDNTTNTNTNTNRPAHIPAQPPKSLQLNPNPNPNMRAEEKEQSNDLESHDLVQSHDMELSYCRGLSKTPLAVPMVATTLDKSVTRNDAKAITSTRLRRLKELSQRPEDALSKDQKHEKKRIIRLEKNRRAAAMSRRKKKMYVKGLEDKVSLMARHLAILEMENAQLRGLLNASHHPMMQQMHHQMMPPNMAQYQLPPGAAGAFASSSEATGSMEPNDNSISSEPSMKKRKLNDGSGASTSISDNVSEISLEPLPIAEDNQSMVLPPLPTKFMHGTPQQQNRLHNHFTHMHHGGRGPMTYAGNMTTSNAYNDMESKTESDLPPDIEFLTMLDDDIIDELVDECGSVDVVAFPADIKDNDPMYL